MVTPQDLVQCMREQWYDDLQAVLDPAAGREAPEIPEIRSDAPKSAVATAAEATRTLATP